jgi:hypothetical protein
MNRARDQNSRSRFKLHRYRTSNEFLDALLRKRGVTVSDNISSRDVVVRSPVRMATIYSCCGVLAAERGYFQVTCAESE